MAKSRNFVYYQPNDMDLKDDYGDCVVRAICKALDVDWLDAYDKLCEIGRKNQCMPNMKVIYEKLLLANGFVYKGISNRKGVKRPTVKQMAKNATDKITIVMRTAHHIVTAKDGKYFDTWDSGEKSLYGYWEKRVA